MKFEGGIYNDDGTKVDESLIPVPNLCVICKKHNTNNFMNNIFRPPDPPLIINKLQHVISQSKKS